MMRHLFKASLFLSSLVWACATPIEDDSPGDDGATSGGSSNPGSGASTGSGGGLPGGTGGGGGGLIGGTGGANSGTGGTNAGTGGSETGTGGTDPGTGGGENGSGGSNSGTGGGGQQPVGEGSCAEYPPFSNWDLSQGDFAWAPCTAGGTACRLAEAEAEKDYLFECTGGATDNPWKPNCNGLNPGTANWDEKSIPWKVVQACTED